MDILALFVTVVGLASWMGASVFMTFFVVPVVTRKLGPNEGSEVLASLQPRLHWLALGASVLMGAGGITTLFYPTLKTPTVTFLCLVGTAVAISLYAALVIVPRTASLRDRLQSSAGSEMNFQMRERYDQANRLAIFLNYVVLFLLLGAAGALAAVLTNDPPGPRLG